MRSSFYINLTNGGNNAVNIRLQGSKYGRMDRGADRRPEPLLLSHDDHRNEGDLRRYYRRGSLSFHGERKIRSFYFCRKNRSKGIFQIAEKLQGFEYQHKSGEETRLGQPDGQKHYARSSAGMHWRRGHNQRLTLASSPGPTMVLGFSIILLKTKDAANCRASLCHIAASVKLQATSSKRQAATNCRALQ